MDVSVPPQLPIAQALRQSEPLARLTERLRDSAQRLEAILPLLPEPMRHDVRSGPLDAEGWTLLAGNGAVAAKLRHMVPVLQQRLQEAGWPMVTLRVKVVTR